MALGFGLVGLGMAVLSFVQVDTPYPVLALAMMLMAAGISITAAPGTTNIMVAVPMSKAGVASAVNDTTRELGGALGIAIFGTIVSSLYRTNLDLGGLGLGATANDAATESLGGAVGTAATVGGDTGQALIDRATSAFTEAFRVTAVISVAIVVVAGIVVARTFTVAQELATERAAADRDADLEDVPALHAATAAAD